MALTPDEREDIEDWVHETRPYMDNDIQELLDWIDGDYDKFERFQEIMDNLADAYSRGEDISEYLEDLEDLDLPDDEKWTFYHG